ncbi:MAG: lgt [Francisellaceae bacterium]|nr:lgt [Francisellaceae bacterium]
MLTVPIFNPIAIQVGPLKIYWYGLMYLLGFMLAYYHSLWRVRKLHFTWTKDEVIDLIFYGALGVIIGGRLGYLFYNWEYFLESPIALLYFWEPGRSFHGGLLGVGVSLFFFSKIHHKSFLETTDFIIPSIPIGLFLGRIGNFINNELIGRVTDLPWGMVFPSIDDYPRHPSQLYEALLEGVVLFVLLNYRASESYQKTKSTGLFLIYYGLVRFIIEFFREPDSHLGFIAFNWLTMGQLLSIPMIIIGLLVMRIKNARIP